MPASFVALILLSVVVMGLTLLAGAQPSQARVSIDGGELVVRLPLTSALLALKREVRIPTAQISDIRVAPARPLIRGMRVGTGVPGWAAIGTWHHRYGRDFLDVRRGGRCLVIETVSAARYARILLEVAAPAQVAEDLKQALATPR